MFNKIDRDHNNEIDVMEFRKFISQLCTDAMLPRLMKTEIELGTRVLLAAACCVPTFCLSWLCMAKYERKKQNDSECIMLPSTLWIVQRLYQLYSSSLPWCWPPVYSRIITTQRYHMEQRTTDEFARSIVSHTHTPLRPLPYSLLTTQWNTNCAKP